MVDPSILLSQPGFTAIQEDVVFRDGLVVSTSFMDALRDGAMGPRLLLRWSGSRDLSMVNTLFDRAGWLVANLGPQQEFSIPSDETLLRSDELVGLATRSQGGLLDRVHADELAYLQTGSIMLSRWRAPLTALTKRFEGAVITYGRRLRDEFIRLAIQDRNIPEH